MTQLDVPFVEAGYVAFLDALLTEPVASRVPNPRPVAFVRVSLVGGAQTDLVRARPRVLIEAYADKPVTAWKLAAKCWGALEGREELVLPAIEAAGVPEIELGPRDLSLPVNYPDPTTSQDRYQFTVEANVNLKEPTS